MARRWHLAHADGCEWSDEELDLLAERLCSEMRIAPYDEMLYRPVVDEEGYPWLMCYMHDYPVGDEPDLVVVWDG